MHATRNTIARPRGGRPRGFTLVELMVVVTVMAILITLMVAVLGHMGQQAKEAATMTTIRKIHAQLEQRLEAFDRQVINRETSTRLDVQYQALASRVQANFPSVSSEQLRVLIRKELMRANFPQTLSEAGITPAGTEDVYDSAEALYHMLTKMKVGESPPVDAGEFLASEVADADGDGYPEFIDAWGQPLRFYRWPTRLIRPDYDGGNPDADDPDHINAPLLIQGLPGHSQDEMVKTDPDDPLGLIIPETAPAAVSDLFEENYHTPNTYFVPLIVSAGADGELGLREPYEKNASGGIFGYLAQPNGNNGALTDNITNRNQRPGD